MLVCEQAVNEAGRTPERKLADELPSLTWHRFTGEGRHVPAWSSEVQGGSDKDCGDGGGNQSTTKVGMRVSPATATTRTPASACPIPTAPAWRWVVSTTAAAIPITYGIR